MQWEALFCGVCAPSLRLYIAVAFFLLCQHLWGYLEGSFNAVQPFSLLRTCIFWALILVFCGVLLRGIRMLEIIAVCKGFSVLFVEFAKACASMGSFCTGKDDKLSGTNYDQWKLVMRVLLTSKMFGSFFMASRASDMDTKRLSTISWLPINAELDSSTFKGLLYVLLRGFSPRHLLYFGTFNIKG